MNQQPDQTQSKISESTYSYMIKILVIGMAILTALRIGSLDILGGISDGLGVIMIMFYYHGRGKCMAIFLLINGLMGVFVTYNKSAQIAEVSNITGYNGYLIFQLITVIYGCLVYIYECIIACLGIMRYEWDSVMRNMFGNSNNNDNQYQPVNSNNGYGGYGSLSGNVNQNQQTVNAFSGRGVTMV